MVGISVSGLERDHWPQTACMNVSLFTDAALQRRRAFSVTARAGPNHLAGISAGAVGAAVRCITDPVGSRFESKAL